MRDDIDMKTPLVSTETKSVGVKTRNMQKSSTHWNFMRLQRLGTWELGWKSETSSSNILGRSALDLDGRGIEASFSATIAEGGISANASFANERYATDRQRAATNKAA